MNIVFTTESNKQVSYKLPQSELLIYETDTPDYEAIEHYEKRFYGQFPDEKILTTELLE